MTSPASTRSGKSVADSPRKCTHLVCPCCGVPYLSDGEVSVVVALYAASSAISISDIARVTGAAKRTVHRVIARKAELFVRTLRIPRGETHPRAFIELSPEGMNVARRITGSDALEAAQ